MQAIINALEQRDAVTNHDFELSFKLRCQFLFPFSCLMNINPSDGIHGKIQASDQAFLQRAQFNRLVVEEIWSRVRLQCLVRVVLESRP